MILAIDPGPVESAYVLLDGDSVVSSGKIENPTLLDMLQFPAMWKIPNVRDVACERIRSYGMPAGAELFETCEWCGRFWQGYTYQNKINRWHWVLRRDVKLNLCGNLRAKDANIRQAIIDRYGGKEKAIGCKKSPGPLYGISGDIWAALAVALTWQDGRKAGAL